MSRVVVKRKDGKLQAAADSCPMGCFKKTGDGEFVINQETCIDCGVCQSIVDEGVILEETEASEADIKYNREN
jgi:ferredoxin-like protein FixX